MLFDLELRRHGLQTLFAQIGNDTPRPSGMKRKIHWVGNKEPVEQKQAPGEKRSDQRPPKNEGQKYRPLASITLGEVSDAQKFFANQLTPSPYPAWLMPNHFCLMHLQNKDGKHPAALFGRVKVCYPSDGYAQNLQELELLFPNKAGAPEVVHVKTKEILVTTEKPLQVYSVRVRCLLSTEDAVEFSGGHELFFQQGFVPEIQTGYIDLLDLNEQNHASQPQLYVIGSRWLASVPGSLQMEVRERLLKLMQWGKAIFNYHPELALPREVYSLNRIFGFKAGFTDTYFIEPENASQTLQIVSKKFDTIFNNPPGKFVP